MSALSEEEQLDNLKSFSKNMVQLLLSGSLLRSLPFGLAVLAKENLG